MQKYQTFLRRLAALLIDNFIMIPLAISDYWFREAQWPIAFFYFWIPLSAAVAPTYRVLTHAFYGQTLAKMAMGVKVVDATTEEPMTMKQAVIRELPQIMLSVGAIYIGLAYFGFDPESEAVRIPFSIFGGFALVWTLANVATCVGNIKYRALHDFIAGTVTIRLKPETE